MKDYQFEEITMALSIIIAILCYQLNIVWLFSIFTMKAIFDTYSAIKYSYISAKNQIKGGQGEKML